MAWSDNLTDEERGYIANKGWDKLAPEAAAAQVVKSYRELERMRPEPAPKEYTFEGLKNPDGSAVEPEVLDMVRGIAGELKLSAGAANLLATRLIKEGADAEAATAAETATRIQESEKRLNDAWGAEKDAKTDVASRAFTQLGLPKEQVDALVTNLGVDKVMQIGYDLGSKLGEAPLHQGEGGVGDTKTTEWTRETALAQRNSWDAKFMEKYMSGDAEATKEWNAVTSALIGGDQEHFQAAPDNFGRQGDGKGIEIKPGDSRWRG